MGATPDGVELAEALVAFAATSRSSARIRRETRRRDAWLS